MARFVIIGVIIAVAFILFALVDAAMSDASRARGVSKPVWVVLIVVLPVLGGILWFVIGKGRGPAPAPARAPDDDPSFTGRRMSSAEIDAHVEELEARLRELDEETFPGVDDAAEGVNREADRKTGDAAQHEAGDATKHKPGEAADPDSTSPGEAR